MSSSFVNKRLDKNLINRDQLEAEAMEKPEEKKKVVATYMSESDYKKLAAICKKKGISIAAQSRMLILEFMDRQQD